MLTPKALFVSKTCGSAFLLFPRGVIAKVHWIPEGIWRFCRERAVEGREIAQNDVVRPAVTRDMMRGRHEQMVLGCDAQHLEMQQWSMLEIELPAAFFGEETCHSCSVSDKIAQWNFDRSRRRYPERLPCGRNRAKRLVPGKISVAARRSASRVQRPSQSERGRFVERGGCFVPSVAPATRAVLR